MAATYKGNLELVSLGGGEFALDQNPATASIFAEAARRGRKVQWVLAYQGDVMVDGRRMSKADAAHQLAQQLSGHVQQAKVYPGWEPVPVAARKPVKP